MNLRVLISLALCALMVQSAQAQVTLWELGGHVHGDRRGEVLT